MVQDFVKTVATANPLVCIFIGSIIPGLGAKQHTLDCLKSFNWATRKKIAKLCKKGYMVEYVNLHKLSMMMDHSKPYPGGMQQIITMCPTMEHTLLGSNSWRPVA